MLLPEATRPAVVAPQAFDTLAFLAGAGAAAEGVRVISRLVPAEQLGSSARSFAQAYADLHGEPPPVAVYAADAAAPRSGRRRAGGSSRTTMAARWRPCRRTTDCSGAGPRRRPEASLRGGSRCSCLRRRLPRRARRLARGSVAVVRGSEVDSPRRAATLACAVSRCGDV